MTDHLLYPLRSFRIGSANPLSPRQQEQIVELCNERIGGVRSVLQNENCVSRGEVEGLGRVVVKHYRRGGLFRYLIRSHYLHLGRWRRCESEYRLLSSVRTLGIHAPVPVAYVWRGGWVYRGWLVTKEVDGHRNLAELSLRNLEAAEQVIEDLSHQIEKLIHQQLYHVDLHPGNVLLDREGKALLVDFDKAIEFRGGKNKLRDKYLCRWRRAVIKHGLPETLSELMCACLLRNFE